MSLPEFELPTQNLPILKPHTRNKRPQMKMKIKFKSGLMWINFQIKFLPDNKDKQSCHNRQIYYRAESVPALYQAVTFYWIFRSFIEKLSDNSAFIFRMVILESPVLLDDFTGRHRRKCFIQTEKSHNITVTFYYKRLLRFLKRTLNV